MKKFAVLTALFVLPIVAYLFFSSGVNHFAKLSVLTNGITNLDEFIPLGNEKIQLNNKITILSIYGNDIEAMEGNAFNLNEKIYDKNHNFKDFQFVVLAENGTQNEAKALLKELETTVDTKKWKFAFAEKEKIHSFFESLKTTISLNENSATPQVFIIDKERKLRGRTDDKDAPDGKLYGYNTNSVAELSNKMTDDVRVILAEYRLALKKYNKKTSTD